MIKKDFYVSPKVEILTVRVEKGFDVSGGQQQQQGLSTQQMQGGEGDQYRWS